MLDDITDALWRLLVALQGWFMNLWEFLKSDKDAIASVESIFTVLGLIVAGSWELHHFFTRREKYPRAIVTQTVQFWEHGEDWLIRVNLHIKNEGHVLLKTSSGHTWIQQMQPWPEVEIAEFKERLKAKDTAPYEAVWPFAGEESDAERLHNKVREIEPGESDDIPMDFFVNKKYKQVLVYSWIANNSKKDFGKGTGQRQGQSNPRPQPSQPPKRDVQIRFRANQKSDA